MKTATEQANHLRDLINGFSTAMLITHGADDDWHARPMAVAGVDERLGLWFVTNEDSVKIQEIVHDTRAHVVCQRDHSAYLSLSGVASLVRDRARVEKLWTESFRVWFPGGKDDPNLLLIQFQPSRAEYWDNTGFNRIAYLWDAAKAYMTGSKPEVREQAHGVVSLA
jgi:general stress protein 26